VKRAAARPGRRAAPHVSATKLLPPDTPPAEYLYLDTDRVLAYLGQIEGGLPASAKRTESETATASASLKGGLIAEVNGTAQRSTSSRRP
jgi:hypothetical protein